MTKSINEVNRTKSILEQLDEGEKTATPGPWGFTRYYNLIENDKNKKVALLTGNAGSKLTPEGQLIILMRNNIRALIDIAKAAQEFQAHVDWLIPQIEEATDLQSAKGNAGRIRIKTDLKEALATLNDKLPDGNRGSDD